MEVKDNNGNEVEVLDLEGANNAGGGEGGEGSEGSEGAAGEGQEVKEGQEGAEGSDGAVDKDGDDKGDGGDSDASLIPDDFSVEIDGQQLSVEFPEDLIAEATEAGLDLAALTTEFFKESKFELSDESRAPLDEKYGKLAVDMFLSGAKARNEAALAGIKDSAAKTDQANSDLWDKTCEQIGGEDNWNKLEEFALASFDDAALDAFNKVMGSGDSYTQKLALADIMGQYRSKNGDDSLGLIEPEGANGVPQGLIALSSADYIAGFASGESAKNPTEWDARRRAGQAKGIN